MTAVIENLTSHPEEITVVLSRNGEEEESRPVAIQGLGSERVVFRCLISHDDRPSVTFTVQALLPGDANPEDNTASATVIVR